MMSLKEMVNMTKLGKTQIRFSKFVFWRKRYCCAQQSSIWDEYRGSAYKKIFMAAEALSPRVPLC